MQRMLFALWLFWGAVGPAAAEPWPQFRGPDGQGHCDEKGLPLTWSDADDARENIAWKTPIPGLGWSSPVVADHQVWLTTADEARGTLSAIALDATSGQIVHNLEVFRKPDLGRISHKNSHASPTPFIDGQRVYVHFGAHGTACLSTEGKVMWKTELAYDHRHGPAASPVVMGDLLFLCCDGADKQFIVALDKRTGRTRWKQDRTGEMAYATPLVAHTDSGDQLIAPGGGAVVAYAPKTGAELWRCRFEGHSVIPRPVVGLGKAYICTGYWTPSLYVIRTDGQGDVTDSHVVGRLHRAVPHTTSPLLVDSLLYMLSDMGVITCVDAGSGKELWHKRLGGGFSASPVYAEGRIYLVGEDATTTVLAAGKKFEVLASNPLEGRVLASPALCDGAIYLRTDKHLVCIRQAAPGVAARAPSAPLTQR